jgi:hypothetical protein
MEESLLKYSTFARAVNGGKILKDHYVNMRGIPDEGRLLRPDIPVINPLSKKFQIYEIACSYGQTYQNGDALQRAYDYKEGKYQRLLEAVSISHPEWEVKQ